MPECLRNYPLSRENCATVLNMTKIWNDRRMNMWSLKNADLCCFIRKHRRRYSQKTSLGQIVKVDHSKVHVGDSSAAGCLTAFVCSQSSKIQGTFAPKAIKISEFFRTFSLFLRKTQKMLPKTNTCRRIPRNKSNSMQKIFLKRI